MPDSESEQKVESAEDNEQAVKAEILKNLPPEIQEVAEIGFSMQRFSGPVPSPLLKKINEEHISKILDIAAKGDEREFDDAQSSKKYDLIYVLIASGLFVFATIFLANKDIELYKEVLKFLGIYLAGVGSGYGINKVLGDKDNRPPP